MTDARSQAIAQRRNLLNIIRELEADSARMLRHAEILKSEVVRLETEYAIGTSIPVGDTQPIATPGNS